MDNFNRPEYATPDRSLLETLSKWSGFVGIMTIISGAFICLGAITTFGISLIPGIITIILGVKLRGAKTSIDKYLSGDARELNGIFENLGSYLKLQGILIIISLVLAVLGINNSCYSWSKSSKLFWWILLNVLRKKGLLHNEQINSLDISPSYAFLYIKYYLLNSTFSKLSSVHLDSIYIRSESLFIYLIK